MADKENEQALLNAQITHLFFYIDKIYQNGELDLFSRFFQTDFRIVNFLRDHPDSHPSQIAEMLHVTRPNVAANLRSLEERGLIERTMDKKNRRQIYVRNTPLAEERLLVCLKRLGALFSSWFDILGQEEVEHLFKILELSSDPDIFSDDLRHFDFGI